MTAAILSALPHGVLIVSSDHTIAYANAAAEGFLCESLAVLAQKPLAQFIRPAERLLELVDLAISGKILVKEHDLALGGVGTGLHIVNLQIVRLEEEEKALIVIDDRGLSHHMPQPESARFSRGMASILAHEVKNPLAGIRGAAQLLAKTAGAEDRKLTVLIVDEVDRIKHLIEEMEIFSNPVALKMQSVNIHEVLQYVRQLAEAGFASHVTFCELYDPSIPHVPANRNLLVQLFINLFKNAAEALQGVQAPRITLSTSYQSGLRFKLPGASVTTSLPVAIQIEDNGPGIAGELRESIFDPFITTKPQGKGLGLAIVAKIIADHGGTIFLEESGKRGTRFKIFLPVDKLNEDKG